MAASRRPLIVSLYCSRTHTLIRKDLFVIQSGASVISLLCSCNLHYASNGYHYFASLYLALPSLHLTLHRFILFCFILFYLGIKRQFQQPVFSNKGKYMALAEMHVKESTSGKIE